jgi:cytidylate kinase
MPLPKEFRKYIPGTYVKKRPASSDLAEQYIVEWGKKRYEKKGPSAPQEIIPPTVCFSSRIGVGALEVAELLASKTVYKVVDKEIIEHIAKKGRLSEKTVAIFDERYPGKLNEFLHMAFGEKSFIHSDYTRHLFRTVLAVAGLGPTIILGRGAHFLLPRETVLAVRFIASMDHRFKQFMKISGIEPKDLKKKLEQLDREQDDFWKKVYGRTWHDTKYFDLMINFDLFPDPQWAAELVALAFRKKFGVEMENV